MREEMSERSIQVNDVALWCSWPVMFPEYVGRIQASGSNTAVVCVMEQVGIEKVAYAAARQAGLPRNDRWQKLYMPLERKKVRG
jgi:hypothetical protein